MLNKLFKIAPRMEHMFEELIVSLKTVSFTDCTLLTVDTEITIGKFFQNATEPSSKPYELSHRPYSAIQPLTMISPSGLIFRKPLKLEPSMFPHCSPISPHTFFSKDAEVFVNTPEAFRQPHLEFGFTSGFSTTICGALCDFFLCLYFHDEHGLL